jgi:hypothetical protein
MKLDERTQAGDLSLRPAQLSKNLIVFISVSGVMRGHGKNNTIDDFIDPDV